MPASELGCSRPSLSSNRTPPANGRENPENRSLARLYSRIPGKRCRNREAAARTSHQVTRGLYRRRSIKKALVSNPNWPSRRMSACRLSKSEKLLRDAPTRQPEPLTLMPPKSSSTALKLHNARVRRDARELEHRNAPFGIGVASAVCLFRRSSCECSHAVH